MPISHYITIYPYPEKPGYLLLYSTRRGAKILVPERVVRDIEANSLSPKDAETLSRLGFLVPDRVAEREEMRGLLQELDRRGRNYTAVVVMNLDCNLDCSYCYEGGGKGKHYLSPATQERVIRFLEEGPIAAGKDLTVVFHGGEPLLSIRQIKEISSRLQTSARDRGCSYSFNFITNGTLLTRKVVEELLPLGFVGAKVTLDGPREIHDRFRPFISGKGTFDVIVRNIKETWDLIKVQIGGNYTQDNYREFPRLLDFLIEEGITPEKIHRLQFVPVTATAGEFALPDFRDGCDCVNEPWLVEASIYLREETIRRGFSTPAISMSACMVESIYSIIVNHNGNLYKCPAFINSPELCIGDLESGIADYKDSHDLNAWKKEECLECAYLPLCFGGCKFLQFVRKGRIEGVDCKKPYLDATLEALIKQDLAVAAKTL